jgi:hypothetical protein
MATLQEQILRASKEIIVKFIETGRVSPNSFEETFRSIHTTVKKTVYQDTNTIEKKYSMSPDEK